MTFGMGLIVGLIAGAFIEAVVIILWALVAAGRDNESGVCGDRREDISDGI